MYWRSLIRFRLLTLLLLVAVLGALLVANTRQHSHRTLGHVSGDAPPIFPGLWIFGHDYGWPFPYKTESFKTDDIRIDVFDRFHWLGLVGDSLFGLALLLAAGALSELSLWALRRITGFRRKLKRN